MKFRVGDKVKYIGPDPDEHGRIGTVVKLEDVDLYNDDDDVVLEDFCCVKFKGDRPGDVICAPVHAFELAKKQTKDKKKKNAEIWDANADKEDDE